jgi:hypothetical protein
MPKFSPDCGPTYTRGTYLVPRTSINSVIGDDGRNEFHGLRSGTIFEPLDRVPRQLLLGYSDKNLHGFVDLPSRPVEGSTGRRLFLLEMTTLWKGHKLPSPFPDRAAALYVHDLTRGYTLAMAQIGYGGRRLDGLMVSPVSYTGLFKQEDIENPLTHLVVELPSLDGGIRHSTSLSLPSFIAENEANGFVNGALPRRATLTSLRQFGQISA